MWNRIVHRMFFDDAVSAKRFGGSSITWIDIWLIRLYFVNVPQTHCQLCADKIQNTPVTTWAQEKKACRKLSTTTTTTTKLRHWFPSLTPSPPWRDAVGTTYCKRCKTVVRSESSLPSPTTSASLPLIAMSVLVIDNDKGAYCIVTPTRPVATIILNVIITNMTTPTPHHHHHHRHHRHHHHHDS